MSKLNEQYKLGEAFSYFVNVFKKRDPNKPTNINIRMYMDFQGVFDYGSYTNYLLNRYKEIYG